MAEAPTGDDVLTPKDVLKVLEELLPAQNQSYELGLKLNLPPQQVEGIHSTYSDPGKRLLQVVIQFLNQLEPRPTWRVIVDALKSSVVNLPQLGSTVEEAHFPNTTFTSVPEDTISSSQSLALTIISSQPGPSMSPSAEDSLAETQHQSKKPTKRPASLLSEGEGTAAHFEEALPLAKQPKLAGGQSSHAGPSTEEQEPLQSPSQKMDLSPAENYIIFVESPSDDLFCPVNSSLLLNPHLTLCCGKHLSEECATRIQGEGGPCPLCKSPDWSTVLNKLFRRQVNELHVFCRHKEKGCWWKGELFDLEHHVQSCSFRLLEDGTQGRTELHDAAEEEELELVEKLLSCSININSRTEDEGETALHLACNEGHFEVVHLLVKAQALLNIVDEAGGTPLYWASLKGHTAVVKLLVESGADIGICDEDGYSPLYVASQEGHTDIVDVLVKAGADVNKASTMAPHGVPLGIAAQQGHTETVKRLLDIGANANHQDKTGQTPVHYASWKGHASVVQLLIENGADISVCDEDGASPLYAACEEGHANVVDILLNAFPNLHWIANKDGASPLYVACEGGHSDVLDILIRAGADIHQATNELLGSIPLAVAAEEGHTEIVHRLLKEGATVNYQDKEGSSALFFAAWKGHTEVVKLLLAAGAEDIPNKLGNTAMSKAVAEHHDDVVQCLLDHQHKQ